MIDKAWKVFKRNIDISLNNPNIETQQNSLNQITKFVEDQKKIILALDSKDVEHVYLYSSKKWDEFNKLSLNDIINNPQEYWKTLGELKVNTLDRNYPIFAKALKAEEDIKTVFGIKKLDSEKNNFATIYDYTNDNQPKFFGIIDKTKIDKIIKLIGLRNEVKELYSTDAAEKYINQLKNVEGRNEYIESSNLVNNLQAEAKKMQQNKLTFSNRCEHQIKSILNNDETLKSTDELQLSLYMMIFNQYFDSHNSLEVSEDDLNRIIEKVWIPYNDTTEVGKIYMNKDKYDEFSNIFYNSENGAELLKKEQTKWILDQIRNGIAHGSFEIVEENGQKLINVIGKNFKSKFKFDCIIDICEELFKTRPSKDIPSNVEDLLTSIKEVNVKSANELLLKNKLDLFDLYVNSVITYNEDLIHKQKDVIFNGLPEITQAMKKDEYIGWIRNTVAHRYRELDDSGNVVIRDKNPEDLNTIEEKTKIDFNEFLNFVNRRNLVETMENNLQIEKQREFID